jgi:hypothetical protein
MAWATHYRAWVSLFKSLTSNIGFPEVVKLVDEIDIVMMNYGHGVDEYIHVWLNICPVCQVEGWKDDSVWMNFMA